MIEEELIRQYESKSNIELLFIASNYINDFTEEAVNAATSLLRSRTGNANLREIWSEELKRLKDLDKKCSLCHKKDIVYSENFYLCSQEKMDVAKSLPGFLGLVTIGIGYAQHKFNYVTLEFKLCAQCLFDRTNALDTKNKPKITWDEYYKHHLCKLYMVLGFEELRTII